MGCPPFWIIVSKLVWYTLKPVWLVPNKICPPFWIIKSNRSQNQSDRFDSASWLVLRQAFVLSLYKSDITWLVGWYVHSTATHTSLLKTHLIFNNIILPLNFPHIYLHDLHLIKPQQTSHIPTRFVSHYHCSLIPRLLLHVSGLFTWGILLVPSFTCTEIYRLVRLIFRALEEVP